MTYNVFGEMLNLAQSILDHHTLCFSKKDDAQPVPVSVQ